jgi:hypothetical protein
VSVSFGSCHADQPFCSKISIYLERSSRLALTWADGGLAGVLPTG